MVELMKFTQRDLDKIVAEAKRRGVYEIDTNMTESELKNAGAILLYKRYKYQGIYLNPRKLK